MVSGRVPELPGPWGQGGLGLQTARGGGGRECAFQPCPHYTLSSYCIEKYFYICNVCCKMRKEKKKRLCLLKKNNSAKEKNPNACLQWFFLWDLGQDVWCE